MNEEKQGIEHIVRKTGLSRGTVSRALNNCGSVSSEVKEEVVRAAEEIRYVPAQKARVKRPEGGYLIAAALPENPASFWGESVRGMREAADRHADVRLVYSLFSRLGSERDALYCVDYLLDLRPDVLIAVPPTFESVRRRLSLVGIPVIFFSESADVRHAFYVGADFYRDGVLLARAAARRLPAGVRMLWIEGERTPMTHLRDEGFRREMMNLSPTLSWIGSTDASEWGRAETPALLARDLRDRTFDALYVAHGLLAPTLTALGKLKRPQDVRIVAYEQPTGRFASDERLIACMEQNACAQGDACIEAARRYLTGGEVPEGGRLLVPSRTTSTGAD